MNAKLSWGNDETREKLLSLEEYTSVHFRALVCWLLDPAQIASFHGEYAPRRIAKDIAQLLRKHKNFKRYCIIEVDGLGFEWLWLRSNYDSDATRHKAKKETEIVDRGARQAENLRMREAIARYITYENTHSRKTRDSLLEEMCLVMISDYKECGDASPFVKILTTIGYIVPGDEGASLKGKAYETNNRNRAR